MPTADKVAEDNNAFPADRRSFLRSAGAYIAGSSLASLTIPAIAVDTAQDFSVSNFIQNFPKLEHLDGIKKMETIAPPDATNVVVLFEQMHWVDGLLESEVPDIEKTQHQLLSAYRSLKQNPEIDFEELYVEGVYHEAEEEVMNIKRAQLDARLALFEKRLAHSSFGLVVIPPKYTSRGALVPRSKLSMKIDGASAYAWIGAAEVLGLRGDLKVRGAKNKECFLKTFELEDQRRYKELHQYLFEKRENACLDIATRATTPVTYVVYGCGHNVRDNIRRYNYSEAKKFALIVLTPYQVAAYREQQSGKQANTE